jgi:uncharacterized Zn finger protein
MCKHVAAVLYGVGIRLDEHPELFFTLRQISLDTLLAQALQLNAKATLSNQKESQPSERVLDLDSADLTALFGLEPESAPAETAQSQIAPEPPKRRRGRPRRILPNRERRTLLDKLRSTGRACRRQLFSARGLW